MRFTLIIIVAAAATAVVFSAGPAMAYNGNTNMFVPALHNYSGAWPVTVTHSQRSNGTGCLTLTGNGPRGGGASLVFGGFKYPYGSFVVLGDILMATISEPLYGQNGALTFTASANRGQIGQGIFENIEGGSNFDFGALAFGTRNGC
jgi:hypothetical protein